jgi:hypothetical protein
MAQAARTRSNDRGALWPPFFATVLLVIVAAVAVADSTGYRQAFVDQVQRFANLNRLKLDRLNRDVHADCYIPVVIATTVRRDGSVLEIVIAESSSVPVVDRYFAFVIEQAAPFPALAKHYDPAPDEITLTQEFRLDVRLWSDGISSSGPCERLDND